MGREVFFGWRNATEHFFCSHPPQPTHGHIFLCAGGIYNAYTQTAGVTPLVPGFAQARIAPQVLAVAGPASTTASLVVPAGNLTVAWQRRNINATAALVVLAVQLPVGTTAQVRVPVVGFSPSDVVVYESGTKVWDPTDGGFQPGVAGITSGTAVADGVQFDVLSGSYSFSSGGIA